MIFSDEISFSIGKSVESIGFYLVRDHIDEEVFFDKFFLNDKEINLSDGLQRCVFSTGVCSVYLHPLSKVNLKEGLGRLTFAIADDTKNRETLAKLYIVKTPSGERIKGHGFKISPFSFSKKNLDGIALALNMASKKLGRYEINIEIDEIKILTTGGRNIDKESDLLDVVERHAVPNAINIFFLSTNFFKSSYLGWSTGIPATMSISSRSSGIILDQGVLLKGTVDQRIRQELFSATIVHEIGHYLGLMHTTESNGRVFDDIDDTHQCELDLYDKDIDGMVSSAECNNNNFMFWQVDAKMKKLSFTAQQVKIIKYSSLFMKLP